MKLISKIRAIEHEITSIGVKINIYLAALIKALYPKYSNYLESLQASGQLKALTFDFLAEKIAERKKAFKKKLGNSTSDIMCITQKGKNTSHDSSRGKSSYRGRGRWNFIRRGEEV